MGDANACSSVLSGPAWSASRSASGSFKSCVYWQRCARYKLASKVCMCMSCSALFMELLVLLEMVSPQRYHSNEPVLPSSHTQVQWLQLAA